MSSTLAALPTPPSRPASPASRPFRPLVLRTLAAIAVSCLLCSALSLGLHAWLAFGAQAADEQAMSRDIAATRVPRLADALQRQDGNAIQQELDQISRYPRMVNVRLLTPSGTAYVAGAPADLPGAAQGVLQGVLPRAALRGVEIPITAAGAAPTGLGQLELDFDRSGLSAQVRGSVAKTALAIVLPAVLLGLLVAWMLHRDISRGLRLIARQAALLKPEELGPLPAWPRPQRRWRDEIDLVADSFQQLHRGIARYVGERDRALQTLGAERDRLEGAVQQRTADLTRLNRVLESASRLSARLIYLPPDAYPLALRMALADIAELLGARACALAERGEGRRWNWTFSGGAGPCPAEGGELPPLFPVDGWQMQWCTESSDCHESRALLHGCAAGSLQVCRHDAADSGQLLACLDLPQAVEEREIALIAKPLFGALARWRDLAQLEQARRELLHQSRSDALTGLANRRAFDERKLEEVRRAWRSQRPLTLVMVDIDHFKRFNDRYGHAAGDDCLARVARAIGAAFERGGECAARIGGEEFAVLLPDVSAADAERRCERIRQTIHHMAIPHADSPPGFVTVSMGIATLCLAEITPPDIAFDRLLKRADMALYGAKSAGRDGIVMLM
jgi:diguanylate cyclase (GGDEF)-like protein